MKNGLSEQHKTITDGSSASGKLRFQHCPLPFPPGCGLGSGRARPGPGVLGMCDTERELRKAEGAQPGRRERKAARSVLREPRGRAAARAGCSCRRGSLGSRRFQEPAVLPQRERRAAL